MKTTVTLYHWNDVFYLFILLLACYWGIKLVIYILERFSKKNITNKKITALLKKVVILYKPVASTILLLGFISINYITHTLLIVSIGVFGYHHIKNYISGIFFKLNPLISLGALVHIGKTNGEIRSLEPFGIIINIDSGEHYMNYSELEKKGFSVKPNKENILEQTLLLETELSKEKILDVLFDNPILDFNNKPVIVKAKEAGLLKLKYTLEKGASNEDLIAFLTEQNISTLTIKTHA